MRRLYRAVPAFLRNNNRKTRAIFNDGGAACADV